MSNIELHRYIKANYPELRYVRHKLVAGVGTNDATYQVQPHGIKCPAYVTWRGMLDRCYGKSTSWRYPTYAHVTVCSEWLLFSNFLNWWLLHYVEGWELDKDLLVYGAYTYSPETCAYVPAQVNNFLHFNKRRRGIYPVGVSRVGVKYRAQCRNPQATSRAESLGLFDTVDEAHAAWRKRKLEHAHTMQSLLDSIDQRIYPNVIRAIMEAV